MSLDEIVNDLSDDDVARLKLAIWDEDGGALESLARTSVGKLVALGDSWFDYPLALDILDHLRRRGYRIRRFAKAGDTLENMIFGAKFHPRTFEREPPRLQDALQALDEGGVDAFLFSGGGNDVAGESLESFLDHKHSSLAVLRRGYVEHLIFETFRAAYEHLIGKVHAVAPKLPIIIHGYGRPIPNGRGYRRLGFEWAGPWLRPALTRKGIVDAGERRKLIIEIIDLFNEMLAQLAADHSNVHYIDLRELIADSDWENELHVDSRAYGKIAGVFHQQIQRATSALRELGGRELALETTGALESIELPIAGPALEDASASGHARFRAEFRGALADAGLPTDFTLETRNLQSWSKAHEHASARVLTLSAAGLRDGIPTVALQLAVAANLARSCGLRLRPIGHHRSSTQRREPLHNWSPLHLDERAADVLYVSFERITGIIDVERDGDDKRVRVYCGTQIAELARRLHAEGLTLPAIPAPGVISVGGAIAIGAHGSRLNDSDPGRFEWPGTISATIAEATVIAWNGEHYVAKRLSQGMRELAFASVSLGRLLLVDVTLRVREDYCLFVEFMRHRADVLLGAEQSPNSLSELLKHQNMEVLGFRAPPGAPARIHGIAWRSTPRPPGDWRSETFLNKFVQARGGLVSLVEQMPWKIIARHAHMKADALLDSNSVGEFEIGPAAAERIYVTSDTLKVEPLGWALVLPRRDLQTAAHRLYQKSQLLLEHSSVSERVHQHLAFELRFAELDTVGQPQGALPPTLSVGAPVSGAGRHVVMWVNILTIQTDHTRQHRAPYLRAFEEFLLEQAAANGWVARPEWSKGWAYGERKAWSWSAERMQRLLADSWPGDEHNASSWAFARATAWKLDPHGVFSTPFHAWLLPRP